MFRKSDLIISLPTSHPSCTDYISGAPSSLRDTGGYRIPSVYKRPLLSSAQGRPELPPPRPLSRACPPAPPSAPKPRNRRAALTHHPCYLRSPPPSPGLRHPHLFRPFLLCTDWGHRTNNAPLPPLLRLRVDMEGEGTRSRGAKRYSGQDKGCSLTCMEGSVSGMAHVRGDSVVSELGSTQSRDGST